MKKDSYVCFDGSGLKSVFHPIIYFFSSIIEGSSLSVNNFGLQWRLSDKSFIWIRLSSRPKIEPWGTAILTLAQDEILLWRTNFWANY